jgi:hypothetical protein
MSSNKKKYTTTFNAVSVQVHTNRNVYKQFDSNSAAICYGPVVHWYTLLCLSLSESRGLLVQTLNVSCGLHVQTLRFWVLTAQCYVSGAVSNLLLLSAILLVIYCR